MKQKNRELTFIGLYESVFPKFWLFIKQNNGELDQAREIFQEALLVYYEKTVQQKPIRDGYAYVLTIAKNLFYKKGKSNKHIDALHSTFPDLSINEKRSSNLIWKVLEKNGKKCLQLLKAFYYDNQSISEITEEFNYSNSHTASVQKNKCLQKIRTYIFKKQIAHEDFYT